MPSTPYRRHTPAPSMIARRYWAAKERLDADPTDEHARCEMAAALARCPDAGERCCRCGHRHGGGAAYGPVCAQRLPGHRRAS